MRSFGVILKRILLLLLIYLSSGAYEKGLPEFSSSVPVKFQVFLQNALTELYQIRGTKGSRLHKLVFKGSDIDGRLYRSWFSERVKRIVMISSCNFTARIDSEGEPGVIYISTCADLNPSSDKKVYWLSILFHEARHLEPEKDFWRHKLCLDYYNQPMGCDESPLGPFGLEKILFGNIAKYAVGASEDFRNQAQAVYEDESVWQKISNHAVPIILEDLR